MVLHPGKLTLHAPSDTVRAVNVACGNYHTLVMCSDGSLFTFGSNCHGQLGVGDIKRRVSPQRVAMPVTCRVTAIATGANHSLVLTDDSCVHTFGSNRKGV
jgi:E3 ubiquitin-protein ligase MYCBP2